jgi:serine/threonine-protein kinase
VVHVLRQVCGSLAEAHGLGIIHRDIKPANVYLCRRGTEFDVVKVLDFGLVKHLDAPAPNPPHSHGDLLVGTPAYLAPELAHGGAVDGRADLYALGCVAFWLLTGRLVFEAETAAGMLVAHVRDVPPKPGQFAPHGVPEALDRLVVECLTKDPAGRPASAEAMAERLEAIPLERAWGNADAAWWWEAYRGSPSGAVLSR